MRVFTMSEIDRIGIERAVRESLDRISGPGFVHVSLDMDVLDPDVAPGVGTPVRGGLTYREAHLALELVAESGLAGSLEVVEVNPILDRENTTATTAVELVASALGATIYLSRSGSRGELRDDVAAVGGEILLLAVGHEVDVELVDADRLELLQLRRRLLGVAEDAEAVADLVGDELAVLRADARVLVVVVELAHADVLGELVRDLGLVAVALDQVHDVVRDHRREPAHLVARVGDVVGDVARRADDALERDRVAARLLRRPRGRCP